MTPVRETRSLVALLAWGALSFGGSAQADIYGGGGGRKKDCLMVFEAGFNYPPGRNRLIRCTDGDPNCDADGLVNGVCDFLVSICVNSTFDPAKCTLNGVEAVTVEHALDNGDPRFDPEFQALQTRIDNEIDPPTNDVDACTASTTLSVRVKGPSANNRCKKNRKRVRITTESTFSGGKQVRDRDKLKLICDPASVECDPLLFFEGTYDRIQNQVFNESCNLSGCHDSQTQAGNLLLEPAGSYTNLINVVPDNPAAAGADWLRVTVVDPNSGDLNTSFLFHKLTGDLDLGFGARMPFGMPSLSGNLIDIIQLWIEAGAPKTGWVPGTD